MEIGTATHRALAILDAGGVAGDLKRLRESPVAGEEEEKRITEIAFLETIKDLPVLDQAMTAAKRLLMQEAGPTRAFMDKELDECMEIIDRLIPAYVEYWGSRGEMWTPLNQEIEFCVEVGEGTQNFLRGKADNLSTYKGGLYIVDKKTAGRMDPRDLLKYEIDVQLTAYIYGLTKHLTLESLSRGGQPVIIRGAIIDLLVKTKVPQFTREFFSRTVDEFEEFEREFHDYCEDIRSRLFRVSGDASWIAGVPSALGDTPERLQDAFPKNTEHCFRWGTCPFRDLCLKDTPVRRALYVHREADYVDEAQTSLEKVWKES